MSLTESADNLAEARANFSFSRNATSTLELQLLLQKRHVMNDYRAFIKTPIDGRNFRDQNPPFLICTDRPRNVSGKQTRDHLSTDASGKRKDTREAASVIGICAHTQASATCRISRDHVHELVTTIRHLTEPIRGRDAVCRQAAFKDIKHSVPTSTSLALRPVNDPVEPSI